MALRSALRSSSAYGPYDPHNTSISSTSSQASNSSSSSSSSRAYNNNSHHHHHPSDRQAPGLQRVSSSSSVSSMNSSYTNISDLSDLPDDMTDASARIRVVVRVRPLNTRPANYQSRTAGGADRAVLFPNGDQQLVIFDPVCLELGTGIPSGSEASCWSRKFSFDKCLWSASVGPGPLATQDDVYQQVGSPVVRWMMEGFNCCVLAYGQTGAGNLTYIYIYMCVCVCVCLYCLMLYILLYLSIYPSIHLSVCLSIYL